MGAHNEKRFTCTKCGKNFDKSRNFKRHVKNHSSGKPYRCSQCKQCFHQKSNLLTVRWNIMIIWSPLNVNNATRDLLQHGVLNCMKESIQSQSPIRAQFVKNVSDSLRISSSTKGYTLNRNLSSVTNVTCHLTSHQIFNNILKNCMISLNTHMDVVSVNRNFQELPIYKFIKEYTLRWSLFDVNTVTGHSDFCHPYIGIAESTCVRRMEIWLKVPSLRSNGNLTWKSD